MATVSLREAKNKLAELARRVEAGERITVTRNGRPVMEMTTPEPSKGGVNYEAGEAFLRRNGITRTESRIADDFDAPLPEDFLSTPITYPDER